MYRVNRFYILIILLRCDERNSTLKTFERIKFHQLSQLSFWHQTLAICQQTMVRALLTRVPLALARPTHHSRNHLLVPHRQLLDPLHLVATLGLEHFYHCPVELFLSKFIVKYFRKTSE